MSSINGINHNKSSAKKRIEEAFISLIKDNEISKITVSQLVERAGVCKSTFYRNYRDVYDVFDSRISLFVHRCTDVVAGIINGDLSYEDIKESVSDGDFCPHILPHDENDALIVKYAYENKDIRILQLLMNNLIAVFSDNIKLKNQVQEDTDFYSSFFIKSILTGYIYDFYKGNSFDTELLFLAYEFIEAMKKSGDRNDV